MKRAEVHAIYYKGDGLPLRRALSECWDNENKVYDRRRYLQIAREVGFETRIIKDDGLVNPSKPVDITPQQDIAPLESPEHRRRLHTVVFELGRAMITTHYVTRDGHFLPLEVLEIDADTPGMINNSRKAKDAAGNLEQYVIAEFTYQEVDDRDDYRHEKTPTPTPSPARALSFSLS